MDHTFLMRVLEDIKKLGLRGGVQVMEFKWLSSLAADLPQLRFGVAFGKIYAGGMSNVRECCEVLTVR